MSRTTEEIIAAAVERGAIPPGRAGYWRAAAARGEDITILDHMTAVPGITQPPAGPVRAAAGRRPPVRAGTAWAPNPLLAELRATRPAVAAAAEADGPPPQLFDTGPLPAFTASGIDPAVLAGLPWQARRPVAAARTAAEAWDLAEKAGDPLGLQELGKHPENAGYIAEFTQWAAGMGTRPVEVDTYTPPPSRDRWAAASAGADDYTGDALYGELFGPGSAQ